MRVDSNNTTTGLSHPRWHTLMEVLHRGAILHVLPLLGFLQAQRSVCFVLVVSVQLVSRTHRGRVEGRGWECSLRSICVVSHTWLHRDIRTHPGKYEHTQIHTSTRKHTCKYTQAHACKPTIYTHHTDTHTPAHGHLHIQTHT